MIKSLIIVYGKNIKPTTISVLSTKLKEKNKNVVVHENIKSLFVLGNYEEFDTHILKHDTTPSIYSSGDIKPEEIKNFLLDLQVKVLKEVIYEESVIENNFTEKSNKMSFDDFIDSLVKKL
jgi:hypothetical protein